MEQVMQPALVGLTIDAMEDTLGFHRRLHNLIRRWRVKQYGVLGDQLTSRGTVQTGSHPTKACCILDAAGPDHIMGRKEVTEASGASGGIYEFLGFPPFAQSTSDAFAFGGKKAHRVRHDKCDVIHAIGPNFRDMGIPSNDVVVVLLQEVYHGVFVEAAGLSDDEVVSLRLLPLSSGIFGGAAIPGFHRLTWIAVIRAMDALPTDLLSNVTELEVEWCIFAEKDHQRQEDNFHGAIWRLENAERDEKQFEDLRAAAAAGDTYAAAAVENVSFTWQNLTLASARFPLGRMPASSAGMPASYSGGQAARQGVSALPMLPRVVLSVLPSSPSRRLQWILATPKATCTEATRLNTHRTGTRRRSRMPIQSRSSDYIPW